MLQAQRDEFSSIIKVKREKLQESSVLAAQMQDALQERERQLRTLSGQASEYGKELAALHQKMTRVAQQVLEVQEAMECQVCMENMASTAFIPCGHCFCCKDGCGSREVSTCPACRSAVTGRIELFGERLSESPPRFLAVRLLRPSPSFWRDVTGFLQMLTDLFWNDGLQDACLCQTRGCRTRMFCWWQMRLAELHRRSLSPP